MVRASKTVDDVNLVSEYVNFACFLSTPLTSIFTSPPVCAVKRGRLYKGVSFTFRGKEKIIRMLAILRCKHDENFRTFDVFIVSVGFDEHVSSVIWKTCSLLLGDENLGKWVRGAWNCHVFGISVVSGEIKCFSNLYHGERYEAWEEKLKSLSKSPTVYGFNTHCKLLEFLKNVTPYARVINSILDEYYLNAILSRI